MASDLPNFQVWIGIGDAGGKFFAGIEFGELDFGEVAVGGGGFGTFDPSFVLGDFLKREFDRLKLAIDGASDWSRGSTEHAFDFAGDFVAVALGDFCLVEFDAGLRVGVGAAAHRDEGDGVGILVFDLFGGVAGPVAADLEIGEDDAVAGVIDPDAADFAVRVDDGHDGEIVVDGAAFGAAVD